MNAETTDVAVLRRWAIRRPRNSLAQVYDGGDELEKQLLLAADEIERMRAYLIQTRENVQTLHEDIRQVEEQITWLLDGGKP